MVNPRTKGASGEREAAEWLRQSFSLAEAPLRNLEQVRSGGHDLVGFDPFCIEVKRCETLALRTWWIQVVTASGKIRDSVPVVMFRQNRKPWSFLISARNIGIDKGYCRIEATEFIQWADRILLEHTI